MQQIPNLTHDAPTNSKINNEFDTGCIKQLKFINSTPDVPKDAKIDEFDGWYAKHENNNKKQRIRRHLMHHRNCTKKEKTKNECGADAPKDATIEELDAWYAKRENKKTTTNSTPDTPLKLNNIKKHKTQKRMRRLMR
jgi:hypothetical protein